MRKPQWISISVALSLVLLLFFFGRTVPLKKPVAAIEHTENDGHNHEDHDHSTAELPVTIDTILLLGKKELNAGQVNRVNVLEKSITNAAGKPEQLRVYHQLANFWFDSAHIFEPYAYYLAEAARLENSEKNLTFAAQLFLTNLQDDGVERRRKWKAMQAKDLFERSLMINPNNDSAKVGLGACYIFGGISNRPMEGIQKILEVADRDSTNLYAQITLIRGSLISRQFDKALQRLEMVNRIKPGDIDVLLMLADTYDQLGKKEEAINWYGQAIPYAKETELKTAIQTRIAELKK